MNDAIATQAFVIVGYETLKRAFTVLLRASQLGPKRA